MIVNCKQGCKLQTQTTASVNTETNEVICDYCQEVIENISDYVKRAMISNGNVIKPKKKDSYTYRCTGCNKDMSVYYNTSTQELVGSECKNNKLCQFKLTPQIIHTIKVTRSISEDNEEE